MTSRRCLRITVLVLLTVLLGASLTFSDVNPFGFAGEEEEQLVDVSTAFSTSAAQPGETYTAAVKVSIVSPWHINSSKPYQDFLIPASLMFDTVAGATPHSVVYPDGDEAKLGKETMSVYHGDVTVFFDVTIDADAESGEYTIPVRFDCQPCDDKSCVAPRTKETALTFVVGEGGTPINEALFSGATTVTPAADANASGGAEADSELQRLIDEHGFWGYFLALGLAFVTGLVLSFSPCTYPMIPITVSIFAGQERSVGKGFIMSLFYVGSMAFVYGLMGLIVSLVGGVFGAWLASPPVVIGIVVVFVIFSLSMFGLYELQVPSALRQKLGTTKGGGGILGAIVLGIVAALVVSPCVGPFVAGILLYVATSGSPAVGFLVLFVFALGLGTLFVVIGTFSSAINSLPRSGEWMETVKKFFGFILLLMAIYFLRTLVSSELIAILFGLLLLAFGTFGGGLDRLSGEAGFFPRLKKFLGVISLIIGVYLFAGSLLTQGLILPPASEWLPASGGAGVEKAELVHWETNLEAGLARAKAEGKPVLIDTWATWCANCKVLEKKTFGNEGVAAEAKRFVPIKLQLETADSPVTIEFKERFGLKQYSLPTTLLLYPSGEVHRIMQGAVGPDEMIEEMRQVK